MKYIEYVNEQIRNTVSNPGHLVLFGQNITAGSCLGGLTKGLSVSPTSRMINSTNSENSLCGFGFGLMINGFSSVFFIFKNVTKPGKIKSSICINDLTS